jgi:hypothetical protein
MLETIAHDLPSSGQRILQRARPRASCHDKPSSRNGSLATEDDSQEPLNKTYVPGHRRLRKSDVSLLFGKFKRSSVKSSFKRFRSGRSSAASSETAPSIWYDRSPGIPIPGHHLALRSNGDLKSPPVNEATKGPSRSRHQDVLSSDFILEFCCRKSQDCIRRFVSNVASSCQANDSQPLNLTEYEQVRCF